MGVAITLRTQDFALRDFGICEIWFFKILGFRDSDFPRLWIFKVLAFPIFTFWILAFRFFGFSRFWLFALLTDSGFCLFGISTH